MVLGSQGLKQGLSPGPDEKKALREVSAGRPAALDGGGPGSDPPRISLPTTPAPQENPYLWNSFADGKLLFHNARLLSTVLDKKDRMVQEFWRLLAICHTVMVQQKDSERLWAAPRPSPPARVLRRLLRWSSPTPRAPVIWLRGCSGSGPKPHLYWT